MFDDLALEPYAGSEPVSFEIPTSDGRLRPSQRAGRRPGRLGSPARAVTGVQPWSAARRSPASIRTGSRFSAGVSGHENFVSYTHDGW